MRPSELGTIAQCETLWLRRVPDGDRAVSVARLVGMIVDGWLTGQQWEYPDEVAWDDTTRTYAEALVQADDMTEAASSLLEERGYVVTASQIDTAVQIGDVEINGRADMICDAPDGKQIIVDLKTGGNLGGAWLQVGGYLLDPDFRDYDGGVLYVPRARSVDKIRAGARLEVREGAALAMAAWAVAMRGDKIVRAEFGPTKTPGPHCRGCPVADCPVRV